MGCRTAGGAVLVGGAANGDCWSESEFGNKDNLSNCFTSEVTSLPGAGLGRIGLYEARIFCCSVAGMRKVAAWLASIGVRGTRRDLDRVGLVSLSSLV